MFTLYIQTKKLEYDSMNIETVPRNHKVLEAPFFNYLKSSDNQNFLKQRYLVRIIQVI